MQTLTVEQTITPTKQCKWERALRQNQTPDGVDLPVAEVYEDLSDAAIKQAYLYDARIKGAAKLVLLVICDRCRTKNYCWPSVQTIARDTGYSVRNVRFALRELERLKYIKTISRYGDGSKLDQQSNLFVLASIESKFTEAQRVTNAGLYLEGIVAASKEMGGDVVQGLGSGDGAFEQREHKKRTPKNHQQPKSSSVDNNIRGSRMEVPGGEEKTSDKSLNLNALNQNINSLTTCRSKDRLISNQDQDLKPSANTSEIPASSAGFKNQVGEIIDGVISTNEQQKAEKKNNVVAGRSQGLGTGDSKKNKVKSEKALRTRSLYAVGSHWRNRYIQMFPNDPPPALEAEMWALWKFKDNKDLSATDIRKAIDYMLDSWSFVSKKLHMERPTLPMVFFKWSDLSRLAKVMGKKSATNYNEAGRLSKQSDWGSSRDATEEMRRIIEETNRNRRAWGI